MQCAFCKIVFACLHSVTRGYLHILVVGGEEISFFLVTFGLCKPVLPNKAKSGMLIVGSNHCVSWDSLKGEYSKERASTNQAKL